MSDTQSVIARLRASLADPLAGWNVGSMGAIAEFHQSPGEQLLVDEPDALTRATARGAIRLTPHEDMRAIAYEGVSPRPHRWTQGIAICLPEDEAGVERRTVLTALGEDTGAIREEDRGAHLFDMGLDQPQMQFCVRTRDESLKTLLEENFGRSLLEHDNPVMAAILHAHPHRVAISRLGRVEVYQKIGGPETGGVSPEGPHTHVLPKLLASGRTHSVNTPIPEGLLPCASLHPANPVMDPLGRDREFDRASFDAFQQMLSAWGPREYVEVKTSLWAAVDAGLTPGSFAAPETRIGRAALRNALRQKLRIAQAEKNSAQIDLLARWRAALDKVGADAAEESDSPGH